MVDDIKAKLDKALNVTQSSAGLAASLGIGGIASGMVTGLQPMLLEGHDADIGDKAVHAIPGLPINVYNSPQNYVGNKLMGSEKALRDESVVPLFEKRRSLALISRADVRSPVTRHYHDHPAARVMQVLGAGPQEIVADGHIPSYRQVSSGDFDVKRVLRESVEAFPEYAKNNKLRMALGTALGAVGVVGANRNVQDILREIE